MCLGLPCVWSDIELGPLPGVQEMMSLVTRLLGLLCDFPEAGWPETQMEGQGEEGMSVGGAGQ